MLNQRLPHVRGRIARIQRGFTLLEVMMAVAILVIITVVVAQFTEQTVRSAETSTRGAEEGLACNGLRHLLAAELSALPANQDGALVGMNVRSKGIRRDAMLLICPAGNAVLTPDAKGYYTVLLSLREIPRGSGKMVLGLERSPWEDDSDDNNDEDDDNPAAIAAKKAAPPRAVAEKLPSDWIPLLPGVQQIEIAYFDARLNGWVDRWNDDSILPNLVRVRLTLAPGEPPYEIVERIPNGGVARLQPAVTLPNVNAGTPVTGNLAIPGAGGMPVVR